MGGGIIQNYNTSQTIQGLHLKTQSSFNGPQNHFTVGSHQKGGGNTDPHATLYALADIKPSQHLLKQRPSSAQPIRAAHKDNEPDVDFKILIKYLNLWKKFIKIRKKEKLQKARDIENMMKAIH